MSGRNSTYRPVQICESGSEDGFAGALGLADADFDRLTNSVDVHEGIIYSDAHDFDMDWACERSLHKYLIEVGDSDKCKAAGNASGIAAVIFDATRPLSMLRYLNHHQNLRYRLTEIRHDEIAKDSRVEIDLLVEHVSKGAFSGKDKKDKLRTLVTNHLQNEMVPLQLTNGHDFLAMLGLSLRDKFGKRLRPQTWQSEVQIHFRLAYSESDFARSDVYNAILKWQDNNHPYIILKPTFLNSGMN